MPGEIDNPAYRTARKSCSPSRVASTWARPSSETPARAVHKGSEDQLPVTIAKCLPTHGRDGKAPFGGHGVLQAPRPSFVRRQAPLADFSNPGAHLAASFRKEEGVTHRQDHSEEYPKNRDTWRPFHR